MIVACKMHNIVYNMSILCIAIAYAHTHNIILSKRLNALAAFKTFNFYGELSLSTVSRWLSFIREAVFDAVGAGFSVI